MSPLFTNNSVVHVSSRRHRLSLPLDLWIINENHYIDMPFLLLSFVAFAADFQDWKVLKFETTLSEVGLSGRLFKEDSKLSDTVTTTATGILFDQPIEITLEKQWVHGRKNPIDTITNYHRALRTASIEDLLRFWHPDSKEGAAEFFKNPEYNKKSRVSAKTLKTIYIPCIIKVESSEVAFVILNKIILGVQLKKQNNEWLLSNVQLDDLKISIISGALHQKNKIKSNHIMKTDGK